MGRLDEEEWFFRAGECGGLSSFLLIRLLLADAADSEADDATDGRKDDGKHCELQHDRVRGFRDDAGEAPDDGDHEARISRDKDAQDGDAEDDNEAGDGREQQDIVGCAEGLANNGGRDGARDDGPSGVEGGCDGDGDCLDHVLRGVFVGEHGSLNRAAGDGDEHDGREEHAGLGLLHEEELEEAGSDPRVDPPRPDACERVSCALLAVLVAKERVGDAEALEQEDESPDAEGPVGWRDGRRETLGDVRVGRRPNMPVSHTTFTIMKTTYHASSVLRCQGSRPRPDMRFPPSAICSLLM